MDPGQKFQFDKNVAGVFDDMALRSVPHYQYQQLLAAKIARHFYQPGTNIYDIGCATGNTLREVQKLGLKKVRLIGVDASEAMLERAGKKVKGVEFIHSRAEDTGIEGASVVLMLYTLQFLPMGERPGVLKKIFKGLKKGGCLVMCEKVRPETDIMGRVFEEVYEDFKRENDYSELEIARKKKALKNVLEPFTVHQNLDLLNHASFRNVDIFFKTLQFCGFLAVKE